jgi:PAS domain S-box-containing protein
MNFVICYNEFKQYIYSFNTQYKNWKVRSGFMRKYELSKDQRLFIEGMRLPFALCQFMEKEVTTLAVSDGYCELFGYKDRDQACSDMNLNMFKNIHPDDTARVTNAILCFSLEDGRLDEVYRTRKNDDSGYMIIHMIGEYAGENEGLHLGQIWFTEEGDYREESGTDLKNGFRRAVLKESLDHDIRYDYLTGLPNLTSFFETSEIGRKVMLERGGRPALLYIDLSGMKVYNHKYGFSEGDKMLRSFARLLGRIFHAENCCHINADRFAVVADEDGLEERLDRFFREWREMGTNMHLPVCVGIYPNRVEEVPVGMAYDRAKIACDVLKGTYSSSFNYYSTALSERIVKQNYILDSFEKALSENWIQVYYQPIMRAINGKVCDEEALARWIDPVKGFLSPADFIPFLEDAGLIYKLDLYMLDKILEHIKLKEAKGYYIVPHSINLSRSDFDACDMVEEIRQRVDAAGVSRDRISIEITESVIGRDFDFIKMQIERFQALGFPVWMDDFGSGYSSLDVLQSIKFNLLKFDMGFMRRLDENADGRIILTELMKMASALGVDTICEGVETAEQAHFLQEIGCSKLQGFFFSKPRPIEAVFEYHEAHKLTGYENPEESSYYESICSLNLYDIGAVARDEKDSLQHTYSTLPMCIIEIKGDSTRFARTNQSYRDFFMRFFGLDLSNLGPEFVKSDAAFMINVIKTCCEQGIRSFFDEKMPDGSIIHSFARRISTNPVNGIVAVAVAVLSIREPGEKLMVEQILSVIEQFGEFMPGGFFIYKADEREQLLYANRAVFEIFGCDGLKDFKALTGFTFRGMVYPEDYRRISKSIKDQVKESQADLDFVEYRIVRKDGKVRWIEDYGHYIKYDEENSLYYVFISDITEKHDKAESDKAMRSAVIEALTKVYDSVWLINDIETERFELFRIDKEMEHLIPANIAMKIEKFSQAFAFYSQLVLEEDRQRFIEATSPEELIRNTEERLIYPVPFRRVFDDGIRNYRIEFVKLDLPGGKTGIVAGFKNVDASREL